MKQRICSIVLVIILFFSSIGLEGCGANNNTDAMRITQGEWITLINEAFGMYTYAEDTPYYTNIKPGNPYFEQIQIAREWNVIDGSVSEFDLDAYVTYAFAAVTLINVTGFVEEEMTAGKKVSLAQDWGFIITDKEYEIEDYISYNDAVVSLYFVKNQWADLSFDHVVEEVVFADDVINYMEEELLDYEISDGKTYIPAYAYTEMEAGDVYVLPANEDNLVASAFVVEEVYQEGDYYVVVNSAEQENVLEHIEELNIEETYTPDLMACNFYDGNGNLVYSGSEYAHEQRMVLKEGGRAHTLLADGSDVTVTDTKGKGAVGFSFSIPVKGKEVKVSGTFENDSFAFGAEYEFWKKEFSSVTGGTKDNEESACAYIEAQIKDIKVTDDIKLSWGKVKRARVTVDYENSLEVGVKVNSETKEYRKAPLNNGNGSFVTNLKKALKSDWVPGYSTVGAEKATGKLKIGSFDLASIGIAKVELAIYVYTEASGKVSVEFGYQATKGVEYKDGNLRYIDTGSHTTDLNLNVSLEGGLQFTLSAKVFSWAIVAVDLKLGLGVEVAVTVHFVDEENHLVETGSLGEVDAEILDKIESSGATISLEDIQEIAAKQGCVYEGTVVTEEIPLKVTNCYEVKFYFKFSIGLSAECLVGKIFKGSKGKLSYEHTTDLLNIHIDNFSELSLGGALLGKSDFECTKTFTPWTALEEESKLEDETLTDETMTYDYEEGQFIGISQYSMSLEEGETGIIQVMILPKGYELKDVKYEVGDSNIARVSEDGTVIGLNAGVTFIKVYIPDTQYEMRCAVIIGEGTVVPFETLGDM